MAHPNQQLIAEIDAFCAAHGMTDAKFGRLALKDWKFVQQLRGVGRSKPRRIWPETEAEVRRFMVTYGAGSADKAQAA